MGLGRKIGRGFLKIAEMGDQIDEGLDDLLGENRTKAGQSFSRDRVGRRAAAFTQKSKQKDFFKNSGSRKDTGKVGSDLLSRKKEKKKRRDIW